MSAIMGLMVSYISEAAKEIKEELADAAKEIMDELDQQGDTVKNRIAKISGKMSLAEKGNVIENNNPEGIVVTILCDRGERYFSVL